MFCQAGGIIASNIYRADDAPQYHRGNTVLISVASVNIVIYFSTKAFYVWRNKQKEAQWNALSDDEKRAYLTNPPDEGTARLDFRFTH
jgi:hypothetical protein